MRESNTIEAALDLSQLLLQGKDLLLSLPLQRLELHLLLVNHLGALELKFILKSKKLCYCFIILRFSAPAILNSY